MDTEKQKIIDLCLNLFGETKAKVKRNNRSVDGLIQVFEEIRTQEEYAQQIYKDLLSYDDDRVRFEAATCCLKLNTNIKEAEKVLKHISQLNPNPAIRFSAEMVLDTWKEQGSL